VRAALLYAKRDLRLVDINLPTISEKEILVRVRSCAVCPTDIRKYVTGNHSVKSYPINLGHEWSGDVVEAGSSVTGLKPGMRVVGSGFAGYADYAMVPAERVERVFELPKGTTYEEATFVEPLADCIHAVVDRANIRDSDGVAVIGAGPMGLMLMMVAMISGAKTVTTEPMRSRRRMACELGADRVFDPGVDDALKPLEGKCDKVLVSIGHPKAIEQGLRLAKECGTVLLFGGATKGTTIQLDPNLIHYREIVLTGSYYVGIPPNPKLFQRALSLISSGDVPVKKLITHRFSLEEIHRAFDVIEKKEGMKAIVFPDEQYLHE
jgi:L-iditol 2-dehydrogenase